MGARVENVVGVSMYYMRATGGQNVSAAPVERDLHSSRGFVMKMGQWDREGAPSTPPDLQVIRSRRVTTACTTITMSPPHPVLQPPLV